MAESWEEECRQYREWVAKLPGVRISQLEAEIERLKQERRLEWARSAALAVKNEQLLARIDALMLEFCPDEMTPEQRAEWAKHQRPSGGKTVE